MPDQPLPNDPAARTETGELKPVQQTQTTTEPPSRTTTTTQETTSAEPTTKTPAAEPPKEGETLLTDKKPPAPEGAPEKYEPFTIPEGYELNEAVATKASETFKKLGLSQAQAQELVSFYSEQVKSVAEAPENAIKELNAQWISQVNADPELGPNLAKVQQTVGRALDSLGDPKLTSEFKAFMDMSLAGNHPAFVKVFYRLASKLVEGTHVSGRGPSPLGQSANGQATKPTVAKAMFPNLPG